jgi:hypothetical protein
MWITTCHRFTSRAEFLAACQTARWICPPGQNPELPQGVAVDIVGPIVAPAQVGEGGAPEWERGSEFLTDLAHALRLSGAQVDRMFHDADAIRG